MKKPIITIIGSINMDLVTNTNKFPQKGETVLGETYQTNYGGKGANQAVAAARLGAKVQMIGQVGHDPFGTELLCALENENVSTKMVHTNKDAKTGTATIILTKQDNRIIVVPGANENVTPEFIKQYKEQILKSDMVLLQFEIPVAAILYCIDLCYENDIPIIVNPAPATTVPKAYWLKATFITPNEVEYDQLFRTDNMILESSIQEKIITTVGKQGVYCTDNRKSHHIPAYPVVSVDSTGAGDTFNGAFAVAVSEQKGILEAIKFANAAAALSTLKIGAQSGMPKREEVEAYMKDLKSLKTY